MNLSEFEEVVRDASGGNAKIQKGDYLPFGHYPIIDQGQGFIGGYSNEASNLVNGQGPWIVFGDHTRALKFVDFPFCMGADGVKVLQLRHPTKADLKYVCHFLQFANIPSAGYSRHYKFLKRLEIPLPPLHEQKRIAAILDKVHQLRQKRHQAIAQLDSLTQSIFVEMFGDLRKNDMNWPTQSLDDLSKRITVGIVVKPASYYTDQGVIAIRSQNIKVEGFDLTDVVYFSGSDNEGPLAKTRIFEGDVVVVRTGQPGKAAVVGADLHGSNAIDVLIVSPDPEKLDSQFLSTFINSPIGKQIVLSEQRGQIQQHLNVGALKKAFVPLPTLTEQQRFASLWKKLRASLITSELHLRNLESLFTSLQHRAFTGQL